MSKLERAVSKPKTLRDHFVQPENFGALDDATARAEASNEACGDVLRIDVAIAAGRVERIRFRARACSAVIGTASLVTSAALGLPVAEALALDVDDLVAAAGGVPPGKAHAPKLVRRVLREVLGG